MQISFHSLHHCYNKIISVILNPMEIILPQEMYTLSLHRWLDINYTPFTLLAETLLSKILPSLLKPGHLSLQYAIIALLLPLL